MQKYLVILHQPTGTEQARAIAIAAPDFVFDIPARVRFQPDGTSASDPNAGVKVALADVLNAAFVQLDDGLTDSARAAELDAFASGLTPARARS